MEWGCHNLGPEKGVVGLDTPVNKNKVVQHLSDSTSPTSVLRET